MRAVSRHSKAIFLVSASFQIVWFRVCVGLLTSSGVVEVYVRVEENIASKVIPNPKRDLVTDIHRSAVLVVVLTVRIRTYPVTKAKICARGLIHLSIDKYVVIDEEDPPPIGAINGCSSHNHREVQSPFVQFLHAKRHLFGCTHQQR